SREPGNRQSRRGNGGRKPLDDSARGEGSGRPDDRTPRFVLGITAALDEDTLSFAATYIGKQSRRVQRPPASGCSSAVGKQFTPVCGARFQKDPALFFHARTLYRFSNQNKHPANGAGGAFTARHGRGTAGHSGWQRSV